MKIAKILPILLIAILLVAGVPILINECYKADTVYITVWSGSDLLEYYGTILGAAITVTSLIATIWFTKKTNPKR